MDVRRGHCWRCMKKLEKPTICISCKIAEYCCMSCLEDDDARHGAKECPMWSPKKCNRCNKTGVRFECSGCYTTWYCGAACQKGDWETHKIICRQWRDIAIEVVRTKLSTEKTKLHFPSYFGSTLALDLLNLAENECKTGERETGGHSEEYNILLAACGDLRHVIQTVRFLPSTFSGKISFVLNDVDPFAIARNILFLFMMVAFNTEDQSSRIATIYFSFRLIEEDHNFLQTCLKRLIEVETAEQLRTISHGLIEISEHDLSWVKDVWMCWKDVDCRIGSAQATRIINERMYSFTVDPYFMRGFPYYIENVPEFQSSIEQWLKDGIVTSSCQRQLEFPYINPTLVGRDGSSEMEDVKKNRPSLWSTHYCIRSDCFPWRSWDYFDMVKVVDHESITVMCNAFMSDSVKKMIKKFNDKCLLMQLKIGDFHDFKNVFEFHHKFDRILSSNMGDRYGHTQVVEQLEPVLSSTNSKAVLISQVYNWKAPMTELIYSINNPIETLKLNRLARRDLPGCKSSVEVSLKGQFILDDYSNDIPFFVNFLRGEYLAFTRKFDRKELTSSKHTIKLPKLDEIQNCHGLVMRNFRCERNHVVPFKFRINARPVTMIRIGMINLEWLRPTPS